MTLLLAFPWTAEIEDELCSSVAGGDSLRDACKAKGMPSEASVYRRMATDDEFAGKMSVARAAQQEHEVDACVHMADEATPEDWQVVKLRIWARQWRAAKLAPKKYGDKVSAELTGANGTPLIPQQIVVSFVSPEPCENDEK